MVLADVGALRKPEVGALRDLDRPAVEVGDDERARRVEADALDRLRVDFGLAQDIVRGFADGGPDVSGRLLKDPVVLAVPERLGVVGRLGAGRAGWVQPEDDGRQQGRALSEEADQAAGGTYRSSPECERRAARAEPVPTSTPR